MGDCAAGAVAGASPGSGNPASTTNAEDVEMTYLCSLLKDVIKKGKFTKVAEIVSLQKPSSSCWTTDYRHLAFSMDLATKRPDGNPWVGKNSLQTGCRCWTMRRQLFSVDHQRSFGPLFVLAGHDGHTAQENRVQRRAEGRKDLRTYDRLPEADGLHVLEITT